MTSAPNAAGGAVIRLLAAPRPDLESHRDTFGDLPQWDPVRLLEQVRRSGLTGRGGAGFPTATKLEAVAGAAGTAVVIANGSEGEPASNKDLRLLLGAPHLVLDGLQMAARVTGAGTAFVHVRREAVGAVLRALDERTAERKGRLGDDVPVTVVEAAAGFVAGQENAIVSRLNGGPARPVFSKERITVRGVAGRPTLVQNVETLAHLALIARYGGAWFREVGPPDAPGTFLATVHSVGGPGVWEVPHGLSLRALLDAAGSAPADSGPVDSGSAVLVGGYHGTWLPGTALDVPLSRAGLAAHGASLGAGVIMPLAASECGLERTAAIVEYLAAQSAQQCGPCRLGLPHLARLTRSLADAARTLETPNTGTPDTRTPNVVAAIREAVGLVDGRGACRHPDGTARLVRSALTTFADDVRAHAGGHCEARVELAGVR